MTDVIWPALRPFLVMAVMLLAMWEPKGRKSKKKPEKEDWIDAKYESLD